MDRSERLGTTSYVGAEKSATPYSLFIWRSLRIPILVFICVNIIGTMGYRLIEGWSFGDSFFMTITTVTTVGFGEVHPLTAAGRLFTSGLIMLGVGTVAYSGFMLGRVLLDEDYTKFARGRKMQREIDALTGHVIVCGHGRTGRRAVENLRSARVPVVVLESDEKKLGEETLPDVYYIKGDAVDEDLLVQAGVARARGLIAALSQDTDNVFVVLTARELNPALTIVARAIDEGAAKRLRSAGAHRVIASDAIGGRRMADVILRPAVVEFLNMLSGGEGRPLQMEEIFIHHGSEAEGKTLRKLGIREKEGINIVALKRRNEEIIINPSPDMVIIAGDTLVAVGHPDNVAKLVSTL